MYLTFLIFIKYELFKNIIIFSKLIVNNFESDARVYIYISEYRNVYMDFHLCHTIHLLNVELWLEGQMKNTNAFYKNGDLFN